MKKGILPLFILTLLSCHRTVENKTLEKTTVPAPDHIVFVWFENKSYSQILNSSDAPYIKSLTSRGTVFDSAYGLCHPSYPNYIAFFSGSYQGITSNDCIDDNSIAAPNLYTVLNQRHVSFRWYSEDLPTNNIMVCKYNNYVERHNPTTIFSNIDSSVNEQLSAMPADTASYQSLPKVSCVTPNLKNDMHDGSIAAGDAWFKAKFSKLIDWSLTHNSIVVIYFDEDNGMENNRIPVIAVGEHIKKGYHSKMKYDHYSFTKTVCRMFDAPTSWAENVDNAITINDIWE